VAVSIATKLILDNSDFIRKSKASQRALKSLDFAARKLAGAFKFAVASVTALTVAFGALILRQTALIDRIGKVTNVISLSTATLQKFRFAAELAGVSSDQADVALRRFARRFGEAAKGTGELLPALRRLGISTRDSEGKIRDLEDVLFDFADGIKATDNETQQLALAFKAFDSEGAELVGTLKEGSEGLRNIFGAAERFNLILDKDLIDNVEIFRDLLAVLTMQITAMTNAVIAQLTPALSELLMMGITKLAEGVMSTNKQFKILQQRVKDGELSVADFFKEMQNMSALREFANEIVNTILSVFNSFTTGFMHAVNFIVPGINLLLDTYTNAVREFTNNPDFGLSEGAIEARDKIKQLNAELLTMQEPFFTRTGRLEFVPKSGADIKRLKEIKTQIAELKKDVQNILTLDLFTEDQFKAVDAFFERYTDNFNAPPRGIINEFLYGESSSQEVIDEIVVVGKKIEKSLGQKILDTLFGSDRVDEFWENYGSTGVGSLTKLGEVAKLVLGDQIFDNLREGLEAAGVGDFVKTMSEGLVKAATAFEDALTQAFITGKADFGDFADLIKQTLVKAFLQKAVTGPIFAAFGLASGGPAKAGQPYIVGEEGPELFIPKNSGTVIPNDTTMGIMGAGGPGMGGGGTTIINNITATDTQSFKQALARQDPEFIFGLSQAGARRVPG